MDTQQAREDSFQRDMVQAVTQLNARMSSLQAAVDNIRIALSEHTVLLRCATKHLRMVAPPGEWQRYAHTHARFLTNAARRNHSSTLMSLAEIEADFVVNDRRALYAEGGDCELAGAEACVFFKNTHTLMRAKLVQGVLYARSGQPVMGKTGQSPDATGYITPNMRRYVLRGTDGCIWEPADDARTHGAMNVCGMRHRVALVHTLEGARVLVDWGVGQFSMLPPDIGLYVLPDEDVNM
jgi:hypothetical protein